MEKHLLIIKDSSKSFTAKAERKTIKGLKMYHLRAIISVLLIKPALIVIVKCRKIPKKIILKTAKNRLVNKKCSTLIKNVNTEG